MNILKTLFSKEYKNNHKIISILGIKIKYFDIFEYYRLNPQKLDMYTKRNIIRNAVVQMDGIHRLKPMKKYVYFKEELKAFYLLKEKLSYFLSGGGGS